jgi:5-(carboxyamino)imidazole ribonucleotide synthase
MIGGGQLARMTAQAAIALGVGFEVLAASPGDSAAQVCARVRIGEHTDWEALRDLASGCDVITFDHEHVPAAHLTGLARLRPVRPGPHALRFTQDKFAMRERLRGLAIPVPAYAPVQAPADVEAFAADFGWPVVLKAVTGGYDGRGVWVCRTLPEVAEVIAHPVAVFVEEHVAFARELAAQVARSPYGQAAVYPVVETVQRDGICHEVIAPATGLPEERAFAAQRIALRLAAELDVTGMLAVELFETTDGLVVNELAMRPHNSGHWTIDGCVTSQFEQHLRAVLDLPLGETRALARSVVMVNVFGGNDPDIYSRYHHIMAADPGVKVHLYGKQVRPGRKLGHVTVLADNAEQARDRAGRAARYLSCGRE